MKVWCQVQTFYSNTLNMWDLTLKQLKSWKYLFGNFETTFRKYNKKEQIGKTSINSKYVDTWQQVQWKWNIGAHIYNMFICITSTQVAVLVYLSIIKTFFKKSLGVLVMLPLEYVLIQFMWYFILSFSNLCLVYSFMHFDLNLCW